MEAPYLSRLFTKIMTQGFKKPEKPAKGGKVKDDSMKKEQYDRNGDGVVDNSSALEGKSLEFVTNRSNHTGPISADDVKDGNINVVYTLEERNKVKAINAEADKSLSADELFEQIKDMPAFVRILDQLKTQADKSAKSVKPLSPTEIIKAITSKGHAFFTDEERKKLKGVADKADVNPGRQQLKEMYESNHDTNAFTDAEKKKLDSIKEIGEKNPTATQIKDSYEGLKDRNAFTDADKDKLKSVNADAEKNVGAGQTPYTPGYAEGFANDISTVAKALDELIVRQVITERRYVPVNTVFEISRKHEEVHSDSAKWKNVVRISAKDLPEGRYSVQASASVRGDGASNAEVQVKATIDGDHAFSEMHWSPKPSNKMPFSGFEVIESFQGSHTFEVSIRIVGAGNAYASNSRIWLRREG